MAIDAATNSPAVQDALGTPIKPGFFCTLCKRGPYQHVTTLKGPNASASLFYAAKKTNGQWTLSRCDVLVKSDYHWITVVPWCPPPRDETLDLVFPHAGKGVK